MKKTKPHNWSYVLYYTLASITILGLIVFVAEMYFPSPAPKLMPRKDDLPAKFITPPGREPPRQDAGAETPSAGPVEEKITIPLNQEKTIGKAKLVYRGLAAGSKFKIDVIIMDLDPLAHYGYRLSIDDARKGFRLADNNFKLLSARKTAIQILHIKKTGP